ncbi:hypothetical protein [Botryobacter ruber]|uniref:hypothetical protein n=1 Tax=Botryobacter ruber TaxID=2171629 RepID=UPI000E0AE6C6|nr:hypothetical protein [Botryobacter ruber]
MLKCFSAWHVLHYAGLQREETESVLFVDLLEERETGQEHALGTAHPVMERLLQSTGKTINLNATVSTFFYSALLPETVAAGPAPAPTEELVHPPVLLQDTGNQQLLAELLAAERPAFVLLNPLETGYPGQLLHETLLQSSADLCLLFTAANLKQALGKGKAGKPLQDFIGEASFAAVKEFFRKEKSQPKREDFLLPAFEKVLSEKGFRPLPFRVGLPDSGLTSHYLVFASKSRAVYKKIKELLLPYTDYQADGVPVFGTNQHHQQQLLLFPELNRFSLLNLMQDLLTKASVYNYKSIDKIADDHSLATPYIAENYQQAFEKLRDQGKVQIINNRTMQPVKKSTQASLIKFIS